MLNYLVIALIITGLFYGYNQSTGQIVDMTQYLTTFVGVGLGVAILYRYFLPKGTAPPNILEMAGLQLPSNGPNGEEEAPCYGVPFKVVDTQYGDKAVLAGYNENVQPHQTGAAGLYEPPFRGGGRTECVNVGYVTEEI